MSEGNVAIVTRGWEAWMRGDVDGVLDVCDTAIEWDTRTFEGWPDADVYYGHRGLRQFLEEWLASWEQFEAGVEEYVDVDDDRVVVLCWQRGLGRDSHAPVHMDYAVVCTLKRGLVTRMEAYSNQKAALEAVGLSA